jgi:hypothetical protein
VDLGAWCGYCGESFRLAELTAGAAARLRDVAPRLHVDARKLNTDLAETLGAD